MLLFSITVTHTELQRSKTVDKARNFETLMPHFSFVLHAYQECVKTPAVQSSG